MRSLDCKLVFSVVGRRQLEWLNATAMTITIDCRMWSAGACGKLVVREQVDITTRHLLGAEKK
jgi:hypothetical protein